MFSRANSRRDFLRTTSLAAAGGCSVLPGLPRVSADEAKLDPSLVQFDAPVESLVRIIEDTARSALLESIADEIHAGRSYQEVLAALLLAGIRNVQPRPVVGFKFHCVMVVNSCHLASLAGPDEDRWLPIFWALDYFKSSQADEAKQSGWRMQPVNDALVPSATNARAMFIDAMETWDDEKADAATAGLVRTAGAGEVFELFARFAARDFRSIGHKVIYLANAWRTLQFIGWQHAEPVLRSLAFAFLNHSGDPNPAQSDLPADRPWRTNQSLLARIPDRWLEGKFDRAATGELMQTFHDDSPEACAAAAADALAAGIGVQSIWDGVFVGAGELLMRQPGIVGLHSLTTANAMRYVWGNVADENIRKQLLLQACSFNALFREAALGRGELANRAYDTILQSDGENTDVQSILTDISSDRVRAAQRLYNYLAAGGSSVEFIDNARRLLFSKGRDAHDYKFCSAVLEDFTHVSPAWRNAFLAMSVFNLKGSGHPDSNLLERAQAALSRG